MLARQRVSEIARLGDVLQDAGIKIGSVDSSIAAKSGRAMIRALIDGERPRPVVLLTSDPNDSPFLRLRASRISPRC
jgi:hypothetical protein